MTLASCLYEGIVRHRRSTPVVHQFQYRLFALLLDLDELAEVFRGRWFWSVSRPNLAWFRRADYLGNPHQPLSDAVRELVQGERGFRPEGPVRLLTHLRYCGFRMNPVSFYYCYNPPGTHVEAIVAEVNNTPWDERHCYVLDTRSRFSLDAHRNRLTERTEKQFHVSPFLKMDMSYAWEFSQPCDDLFVAIENWTPAGKIFEAQLEMQRRPMTTWQLARVLLRYPLMTAQIYAGIHWQAGRLWSKGVSYVPHPGHSIDAPREMEHETFAK